VGVCALELKYAECHFYTESYTSLLKSREIHVKLIARLKKCNSIQFRKQLMRLQNYIQI
jgi:hypothetical protein